MRANSGSVLNVITVLLLLSEAKNLLDAAKGSSGRFRSKVRKGEAEGTSEIVGPRKSSTNVGNKERYEAKDSLEQNLDVDFDEYNLWKEIGYDGRGQWTDAETFREDENDYNNISEEDEETEATSDTELLNKSLTGYDWRVRPPGTNLSLPGSHGPVVVTVNMLIRSISRIDDVNMEYSVQLTFRESWVDGRLAYGLPRDNKPDFLILATGQQIWMPDSFFQNEKQAQRHMIDKPNVLVRVHKDGTILYSVRISLVLSCPMHLQYYPMDIQTCLIDLASYAYTTDDIEYVWKSTEPVQLKEGLSSSLPSFQLNNVTTTYCTSKTNTGVYSCLRTILELRRQFSYYLLQLYVPSSMLVIVSWVSFWLDRSAVPARVTLGVTTFLTMTTQASGINAKLPPVSYTKAIDIWIGACLTFIFGALLEFAWVTYISSRGFGKGGGKEKKIGSLLPQKTRTKSKNQLMIPNENAVLNEQEEPRLQLGPRRNCSLLDRMECGEVWVKRRYNSEDYGDVLLLQGDIGSNRTRRQKIIDFCSKLPCVQYILHKVDIEDEGKKADYVSRIVFPIFFILFNFVYWLRYSTYRATTPT